MVTGFYNLVFFNSLSFTAGDRKILLQLTCDFLLLIKEMLSMKVLMCMIDLLTLILSFLVSNLTSWFPKFDQRLATFFSIRRSMHSSVVRRHGVLVSVT